MHVTTVLAPTCHLELWKSVFKCQIVFQVVLFLELPLNLKYFGVCPKKLIYVYSLATMILSYITFFYGMIYSIFCISEGI